MRAFQENMKSKISEMQESDLSPCSCTGERLSSIATGTDLVLNGVDWKSSRRPEGNNTASVKQDFIFLKKGNVSLGLKTTYSRFFAAACLLAGHISHKILVLDVTTSPQTGCLLIQECQWFPFLHFKVQM